MELNTTVDASKTRSEIINSLIGVLPAIVPTLHDSYHMTIITKVRVSHIDHMNDDTPEVDSFSCECYWALSSPHF